MLQKATRYLLLLGVGLSVWGCGPQKKDEVRLLVFSKTVVYRHASIPAGKQMIIDLATEQGWKVDTTEDAEAFTDENLPQYSAVIFLSTTGDVLNNEQQVAFQRYIQAGGGYVGIHAASDTEYGWPWYGRLCGAYFDNHPNNPNVRTGTMRIVNQNHSSTRFFGQLDWERTDEFYNFKQIYHGEADGIIPLIEIDETSYEGGTNGKFHPMSWYHEYDGGRAWYTNFGHTTETYAEPLYRQHVLGGLTYAIGDNRVLNYAAVRTLKAPDASRFSVSVLAEGLAEPGEMAFLPDNRILFTQRRGQLQLLDPETQSIKTVGELEVFSKMEDGLVGLAVDPKFYRNHWVYLYYAPNTHDSVFRLSRFTFRSDSLHRDTEKILLEVPVQRRTCCHTGGSIEFGPDRMLYLSTGDDTNPFETRYAPINELPGREPWDAQRSSANTQDLRGKILRIIPESDGTYRIPDGNLFPKDGSQGRPEIYVMGCRNPYRIAVDPRRGWVYWGDVGPDGREDSVRGPKGYDEINLATKAGFHGWPYFIGNNYAYQDYDFRDRKGGKRFDAIQPVNYSPNNSGIHQLPPAQPPLIWYPYDNSPAFSSVGQGSRNAMAGPVYYREDFEEVAARFPPYFDRKVFVYDFMRNWVLLLSVDEKGQLENIERFLPDLKLSSPMDMAFGPDGALYILEYGLRWFSPNPDARLIRIAYAEGNRPPIPKVAVDVKAGAAPLTVHFSAHGSVEYDEGDQLEYLWTFPDGSTQRGPKASYTFTEPDTVRPYLTLSDGAGHAVKQVVEILVGNSPPEIALELAGNRSFFWPGQQLPYQAVVSDQEDGSTANGRLAKEAVAISFDYLANSMDPTQGAQDHAALANAGKHPGENLIQTLGCIACHGVKAHVVGPGYEEVSRRYANRSDAESYLIRKIQQGGSGVWGSKPMPAMPQVTTAQARQIAQFIIGLAQPANRIPLEGQLAMDKHNGYGPYDSYTLRISYEDQGNAGIGALQAYEEVQWRSALFYVGLETDVRYSEQVAFANFKGDQILRIKAHGYAGMGVYDLTDIERLSFAGFAPQRDLELTFRLDSVNGPVWGRVQLERRPGKNEYQPFDIPVSPTSGMHRLYIVPVKEEQEYLHGDLAKLYWMFPRRAGDAPYRVR